MTNTVTHMFDINPTHPSPIWLQIEEGIRRMITLGSLTPGGAVPSVRDLARTLRVNPNTVARAYQRLSDAGVLNVGYAEAGPASGRPVILLHGFPADSAKNEDLAEAMRDQLGADVFMPHQPGLGDSPGTFSFEGALRAMPPRVNWYSVSRSPALAAAAGSSPLIRASSATITKRGVNAVPSSGNIRRACNPSISVPACFPIAAARIERNLLTVSMRRSRLARDHFREHLIQ